MIVKNAAELGTASARSAEVQAKSKASGRIQEDEIFSFQGQPWTEDDYGRIHRMALGHPHLRMRSLVQDQDQQNSIPEHGQREL